MRTTEEHREHREPRTSGIGATHDVQAPVRIKLHMVLPFVRDLFADVENLPAFSRVASHLKEGTGRIRVSGLTPTAKALLLVLLQKAAGRPLIVVVADNRAAEELLPVLQAFCELSGGADPESVVSLPARDVLALSESLPAPGNSGGARRGTCGKSPPAPLPLLFPRWPRPLSACVPPTTMPTWREWCGEARHSIPRRCWPPEHGRLQLYGCGGNARRIRIARRNSGRLFPGGRPADELSFSEMKSNPSASLIPARSGLPIMLDEAVLLPLTETPVQ